MDSAETFKAKRARHDMRGPHYVLGFCLLYQTLLRVPCDVSSIIANVLHTAGERTSQTHQAYFTNSSSQTRILLGRNVTKRIDSAVFFKENVRYPV